MVHLLAHPLALVVAFACLLLVSWRRWMSPLIDAGRELDLPLRLLHGEMLYRDVYYLYPPLSPYFNALLYRIFGPHLNVLLASGVICSAAIVALSYRIARRLLPPAEATVAALAVMLFCVFKPAGNLIFPYAFAALHGLVWALGALLLTLRYGENGRRRELLGAGALVGLAAITKQEFAMAAAVAIVGALVFLHRARGGRLATRLALVAAPAALIALPVYGLLLRRVGWETLVEDCHLFYTHLPPSLVFYNAQRTGLAHPFSSLAQMLSAAAVVAAVACAIALLSMVGLRPPRQLALRLGLVIAGALGCLALLGTARQGRWDGSPLRAVPLLLIGVIVAAWRGRRRPDREAFSLFAMALYSLAILARVVLRVPSGGAYGAFFLPTSVVLVSYLVMVALPRAIADRVGDARAGDRARLLGQGLMAALLLASAAVFAVRYRTKYDFEVRAPRGSLLTTRPVGVAMQQALDFIAERTAPDEAIAVLPEGSDLAFLSGRRTPLRLQIFHPGFLSEEGERAEIRRLEAANVRYVLLVNRSMREFGANAFGRDYFPTLGQWIEERYRIVEVCGPTPDPQLQIGDPAFFIKVLARETL